MVLSCRGSVYTKVGWPTVVATSLSVTFSLMRELGDFENIFTSLGATYAYQVFTFVLGFVLVFRCQQAYNRFWEGRGAIETMSNNWLNACQNICVFDSVSSFPQANITIFRNKMISLFSLLHASALRSMCEHLGDGKLEVIKGLDEKVSDQLNSPYVHDEVYLVYTWIQDLVVLRLKEGGLAVPPPVATRLFQEMTTGMAGYNNAKMLHDTPFPFPYVQIVTIGLMVFTLTCPFVMACITWHGFGIFFSFIAVSGFYALEKVAQELEDPFGDDDNDLPLTEYQHVLNVRLRQLLALGEGVYATPNVSQECEQRAALGTPLMFGGNGNVEVHASPVSLDEVSAVEMGWGCSDREKQPMGDAAIPALEHRPTPRGEPVGKFAIGKPITDGDVVLHEGESNGVRKRTNSRTFTWVY